jgi:D-alanyl-D-alanine carboxypeptidase
MTLFTHGVRRAAFAVSLLAAGVAPLQAFANPRIVVDVSTLKVLDQEQPFRKWYPASLTKLMTAYTTFRAIRAGEVRLDSLVTMSKRAAGQPASKMYYKPGQQLTLDSALKLLLVKSANDVAVAIAETVSGTQENFVLRMNAEAARIGMSDTHFINPNGLPGKGQYTTARDLALLTVLLKREFPEHASYFKIEGIDTGKRKYPNYNMLIGRFDGADGMKTGFICASGFNQISSATRNGRSVISVVLGTDSLAARADMSADLLQKAFTTPGAGAPRLDQLPPDADAGLEVADITRDICSAKGAKVRSESRDEAGRQKLISPYIHEMDREPAYVFAGLIPGSVQVDEKPAASKKSKGKKADSKKVAKKAVTRKKQIDEGDATSVPVPQPKPQSQTKG